MVINLSGLNFGVLEDAPISIDLVEEWLKKRWGKFTSSEMHRLMSSSKDGGLSQGAHTYIIEKAAEVLTEFSPEHVSTLQMEWGKEYEAEAIQVFSELTGYAVINTGNDQKFIASSCNQWGGTPDGRTADGGVEVKCPMSKNHLLYKEVCDWRTLKYIEPKYYWQVQGYIELTGSSQWYFISYDPRFIEPSLRLHWCEIQRNQEDIDYMLSKIALAVEERDRRIKAYESKNLYAA